jgi:hypothetical protein
MIKLRKVRLKFQFEGFVLGGDVFFSQRLPPVFLNVRGIALNALP